MEQARARRGDRRLRSSGGRDLHTDRDGWPAGPNTRTAGSPSPSRGLPSLDLEEPIYGSSRDGRLWISIPEKDGVTLLLIDSTGKASPGWPIVLPDVETCDELLPADDATVRVICSLTPPARPIRRVSRAFAFDANAEALPGWPVDIEDGSIARVVGQDVVLLVNPLLQEGGEAGDTVARLDGRHRQGWNAPKRRRGSSSRAVTAIGCIGVRRDRIWRDPSGLGDREHHQDRCHGVRAGRSAAGLAGDDRRQRIELRLRRQWTRVCSRLTRPTSEPLELSSSTKTATNCPNGSADQAIVSTGTFDGASGEDIPGPPIVADDGTVYIISTAGGTTAVVGLDPSGKPLAGWPYESKLDMQWTGFCGDGDTGCGYDRTEPAIGPDNSALPAQRRCNLVDGREASLRSGADGAGSRWLARRPQTGGIGVLGDGRRPRRISLMGARDRTREAGILGDRPGDRGGQHGPLRDHDRRAVARRDPRLSPERRHAGRPPGRRVR